MPDGTVTLPQRSTTGTTPTGPPGHGEQRSPAGV